jgi:hypothetical protein
MAFQTHKLAFNVDNKCSYTVIFGSLTVAINLMAACIQNEDGPVAYGNEG